MAFINPVKTNITNNSNSDTDVNQAKVTPAGQLVNNEILKQDNSNNLQIDNLELKTELAKIKDLNEVTVTPEINVNSIISEISNNLNNNILEKIVDEVPENNLIANQYIEIKDPQASNTVNYNTNAQDTFQENYKSNIKLSNPIKIEIKDDGITEINSITSSIASQITSDKASNVLQYKNYSLDEILIEAINMRASDVHLAPNYRAVFRIDGQLKTVNSPLFTPDNIYNFAKELTRKRADVDLEKIKEFDLTYTIGTKRFRVNIFRQMSTFSIVMRIITEEVKSINTLGLPANIVNLAKFANGLILVTGPTGSGKSTTLASLLNHINQTEAKHIITLEDPIEYVLQKSLSLIDQREFGTDFSSWPSALRSVLRQDPDIVLIGEMRDLDSIEAALQVAETGHLVFGTLHTNSAAQSIDRIIDIFPADKQDQIRVQLSSVLRAIVSQRLVPLAGGGRLPVVELVLANIAVQNAIRESKVFLIDNIIQTSGEDGMISLEKSLVKMVKEGKISATTAKAFSIKPNEIDILLRS